MSLKLTDTEIQQIANNLKLLSPEGYIPFPLFVEFNRLKVTVTIEIVPMCFGPDGQVKVVLYNRGPDDLWWPNLFHTPGTCLISDDIPTDDEWGLPTRAFDRLKKGEMKDLTLIGEPMFVNNLNHQVRRGPESDHVYIQKVEYDPKLDCFYDVDHLPPNIVDHQVNMIHRCAKLFPTI
jgi:hypothetical protein